MLRNVSYSTPNMKLLDNLNFKIYEAERIAVVPLENSGRSSLLNLLLFLVDKDDTGYFEFMG